MDMWKEMLKEYEEIVYIPLSSALSGSCMTAEAMANEDEFAGKVFVVDNGRVATPMHRSVLDAKRRKSQLCDSFGSRCPEYQTCYAFQHRKAWYLPEMPWYEEIT